MTGPHRDRSGTPTATISNTGNHPERPAPRRPMSSTWISSSCRHLLPMTYAIEGLRSVLLRGADLSDPTLRLDIAFLAGAAILFVTLAGATIRREVA